MPTLLPLFTVLVNGPSMVPTLRHGDMLVVRRSEVAQPGDLVVAAFLTRPDLLVVKRVVRPYRDGWWIQGDNPFITDDSRAYGPANVIGRVVLRYWPKPRFFRPSK